MQGDEVSMYNDEAKGEVEGWSKKKKIRMKIKKVCRAPVLMKNLPNRILKEVVNRTEAR